MLQNSGSVKKLCEMERLHGADLEELLLHDAVVVPAVAGLLHAVDREVEVELLARVPREEPGREPLVVSRRPVGHAPEREEPELLRVPREERRRARHGNEHVERDRRALARKEPVERLREAEDLRRAGELPEEETPDERAALETRDPGVVAEEVVLGREVVLGELARARRVDAEPVVAMREGSLVHEAPDAEHVKGRRVDDAIHEVRVLLARVAEDGLVEARDVRVALVRHVDEALRRHEPKRELRDDPEGAEAPVHHLEEELVLAARRAAEDLALARDHLVLEAGVVKAAVAEGCGLDRAARDRAAHRDRLELGDDDRDEPARERRPYERLERDSRLADRGR